MGERGGYDATPLLRRRCLAGQHRPRSGPSSPYRPTHTKLAEFIYLIPQLSIRPHSSTARTIQSISLVNAIAVNETVVDYLYMIDLEIRIHSNLLTRLRAITSPAAQCTLQRRGAQVCMGGRRTTSTTGALPIFLPFK